MELTLTRTVAAVPDAVFARLADLAAYGDWLETSETYRATGVAGPVQLGTTYDDTSAFGAMRGEVVEHEPPTALAFRQVSALPVLRTTIEIRYELKPTDDGTHLTRTWRMTLPWGLGWSGPRLLPRLARENERIVDQLVVSFEAGAGD